jgi:formylmethanofuran dehydrogenase subunit E
MYPQKNIYNKIKQDKNKMTIFNFIRKLYNSLATCDNCGGDGGVARSGELGGRTLCGSCYSDWKN